MSGWNHVAEFVDGDDVGVIESRSRTRFLRNRSRRSMLKTSLSGKSLMAMSRPSGVPGAINFAIPTAPSSAMISYGPPDPGCKRHDALGRRIIII